jgi:hypothetical protein
MCVFGEDKNIIHTYLIAGTYIWVVLARSTVSFLFPLLETSAIPSPQSEFATLLALHLESHIIFPAAVHQMDEIVFDLISEINACKDEEPTVMVQASAASSNQSPRRRMSSKESIG